ncbi:MAG: hypothetical protein KDA84_01740, partial [Planctomycetaceae bacterium]|nr:hypothetical protein [Planctomycetaceae bacterium]
SATDEVGGTEVIRSDAANIWTEATHNFVEETVQDHYAQLDKGLPTELVQQEPKDWETWDPVAELRCEEAAFAAPPFSAAEPEITIINAIPEFGEEWQPEDLNLSRHQPVHADPSEMIDRVMPLIDAAMHSAEDSTELNDPLETELEKSFKNSLKDQSPEPVSDPVGTPFFAEASLAGDFHDKDDLDEIVSLMNQQCPLSIGNSSEESREYVAVPETQSSSPDIEEQIAQMVLDTYNEVQPLIWNSTTETEPEAKVEPPAVAPGEEPIRDPGDSTPFDELRETLEQAVKAATEPVSELVEEPEPQMQVGEESIPKQRQTQAEYDIVLPEPVEETEAESNESQTAAPFSEERETKALQRPHSTRNLFSKIRRKEQA